MHFPGWLPHKASPIHFHKIFPIFLISSWAEHKQIPTICISWRLVQAGPLCVECWGRRLTRLAGWVRTPGPRCNCGCHHHGAPSLPSPNTATTHTLHSQTYSTNEFLNGRKVFMNNCINLIDFFHILNWTKDLRNLLICSYDCDPLVRQIFSHSAKFKWNPDPGTQQSTFLWSLAEIESFQFTDMNLECELNKSLWGGQVMIYSPPHHQVFLCE